jgi:predicted N-acetyltransferase YhbS
MAACVAVCFVATAEETTSEILGYYTLSAVSIVRSDLPPEFLGKLPRYRELPATLLGRLAVATAFQGGRIGARLLASAMARALNASGEVASFALVVDPKDEGAAGFYRRFGFRPLASARLFLPMKEVAAFLSAQ